MMLNIPAHRIVQYAWVVNDLDLAMKRWTGAMGLGPFFVMRHLQWDDPHYRGRPLRTDYSVALAQAGETHIELLSQHDDTPSIYRDLIPKGKEGFHHVAVISRDVDAEIAHYQAQGFEQVFSASYAGSRAAFVDTSALFGGMLEIIEDSPMVHRMLATLREAAGAWDGCSDPIRDLL